MEEKGRNVTEEEAMNKLVKEILKNGEGLSILVCKFFKLILQK